MVEFELSSEQFCQHSTPDPSLAIRPPIKPRSTTQERCGIKTHPCRSEIELCVSTSQSDDLPNCSLWKIHRNHAFPNVLFKQSFPKCCHSGRGGRLARLWARLLRELHSNVTDEAIEAGSVSHHLCQVTSQANEERRG